MPTNEELILKSIENEMEILLKRHRAEWNMDLCESIDIEEFGFNEYLGGKAEAFEESLEIIKKYFHDVLNNV